MQLLLQHCFNRNFWLLTAAVETFSGDAIEGKAIKSVFLEHATLGALAFSSTKVNDLLSKDENELTQLTIVAF